MSPRAARWRWLAVAIVLCAFGLRLFDLERRPLHFDEGNNVYFGQLDAAGLLRESIATIDTDPPGHRFALGLWMLPNGRSPFSIRFFSVWFSTLAVAALFALARQLGLAAPRAAAAALLLAGLAYALDNGQQAKGYALGLGSGLLAWLCWLRLTRRGLSVFASAAYVLSSALALSTHFFAAALLPMHWVWLLLARRGSARMLIRRWPLLLAQIVACTPVGSWSALTFSAVVRGTAVASADVAHAPPLSVLLRIFGEFVLSQFAPPDMQTIAGAAGLVLFVGGVALAWRRGERAAAAFALTLLLPIAGAVLLSQRVTFFFPRFLLFALPALCVAFACLLRANAAPIVAVLALLPGLIAFYRAPIDGENDYRALVAELRTRARPGDAALATYIWTEGIVDSYAPALHGMLTWQRDVYDAASADIGMPPIAAAHRRIWSFNFRRDPDAPASASAHWLRNHTARAGRIETPSLKLLLFETPSGASAPLATQRFDNGVTLAAAAGARAAARGDSLAFMLRWQTARALPEDLTIFVQVLDAGGALIAQSDGDPLNGLAPAFTWQPGQAVADPRALLLPLDRRGAFRVVAGLYRRSDGVRILSEGADTVTLFALNVR
jgi:hypothetical protein